MDVHMDVYIAVAQWKHRNGDRLFSRCCLEFSHMQFIMELNLQVKTT